MKSRIVVIFLGVITVWGLLLSRGIYLQVLPNAKLEKLNKKQFLKKVKVPGRRGAILDRNGEVLAVSLTAYSLFADPKIIKKSKTISKKLSKLLKIPYKTIYKKIAKRKKQRRFVWLKRKLPRGVRDEIKSWKIRGLGFIEEDKRVYPNEGLLAQVLGFVSSDGRGLEGIEKQYQNTLVGKEKWIQVRKDAKGRPLLIDTDWLSKDFDGKDISLTIDKEIQFQLEKELRASVEKHKADSAVGVVLDARTSEVLAMANIPTFDLNKVFTIRNRMIKRNRAVTDAFEPGSTLKTMVIAAGLKNETVTPNKKYFCENGSYKMGNRIIREADSAHSFGWLTVSEILAHSSNIGTSKISEELGSQKYRNELLNFGFGKKTKIDFPGESKGILNALPWRKHLLSNISFGHGISVTPIQMAASYGAIANKGVWRQPRLLHEKSFNDIRWKKVSENNNDRLEKIESFRFKRDVLKQRDAELMSMMLTSVTGDGGTGKNARVPGFLVAGKTGTAQKVKSNGRGYMKGAYVSSFAGFVPSSAPEFVIYIAVDNPKKTYYGSQVAAPVFSKVASHALRLKSLSPVLIGNKNLVGKDKINADEKSNNYIRSRRKILSDIKSNKVPNLKGLTLREVISHVHSNELKEELNSRLKIKVSGHGIVSKVTPTVGQAIPKDKVLTIILKEKL